MIEEEEEGKEEIGKIEQGHQVYALDVQGVLYNRTKESVKKALQQIVEERDGNIVRIDNQFFHIGAMSGVAPKDRTKHAALSDMHG